HGLEVAVRPALAGAVQVQDDGRAPAALGATRYEHLVAVRRAVHGRGPHHKPGRRRRGALSRDAVAREAREAREQQAGGLHVLRRMSAIFVSAASPAMCPCVSLYCLKWSTSASNTENGRLSRRERCASLDSVSMRCRRLYRPVRASVTESRSSSAWLSRSRRRETRVLNTWVKKPTSPVATTGRSTERSPAA